MERLPLFVDAHDVDMLVIGGGAVGARKASWLHRAGASVAVLSPVLHPTLDAMARAGSVRHLPRHFDPAWMPDRRYRLVIAATGDAQVNRKIAKWCADQGFWLNAVDDPENGDVQLPAVVDRGQIQVAVSSGGASPVLARQIRERIEALLPDGLDALARAAASLRQQLKRTARSLEQRRHILERAIRAAWGAPAETVTQVLNEAAAEGPTTQVWLVGAGPGAADLITLRGLQVLQTADVIVYDRLVGPGVLDLARRDAEFIAVGKTPGGPCVPQRRINEILIEQARQGKLVCRLKGGDPGIFGRVGEEIAALRAADISYAIVPGITAALAAAASAGISLTHRDHAHAVVFATAHGKDDKAMATLSSLLAKDRTLSIYMGVRTAPNLVRAATDAGLPLGTPVLIVERASTPQERSLRTHLGALEDDLKRHHVQSPALITVGEVAAQPARRAPELPLAATA